MMRTRERANMIFLSILLRKFFFDSLSVSPMDDAFMKLSFMSFFTVFFVTPS